MLGGLISRVLLALLDIHMYRTVAGHLNLSEYAGVQTAFRRSGRSAETVCYRATTKDRATLLPLGRSVVGAGRLPVTFFGFGAREHHALFDDFRGCLFEDVGLDRRLFRHILVLVGIGYVSS